MTKKSDLKEKICADLCRYYKPGKNEELACRGYDIAERIQEKKRTLSFKQSDKKKEHALVETLVKELCLTCPFFEQDCDFMLDRSKSPCGGFILLIQNLESGAITLTDITI
jgi:hypothetical protein